MINLNLDLIVKPDLSKETKSTQTITPFTVNLGSCFNRTKKSKTKQKKKQVFGKNTFKLCGRDRDGI